MLDLLGFPGLALYLILGNSCLLIAAGQVWHKGYLAIKLPSVPVKSAHNPFGSILPKMTHVPALPV